MKYFAGTYQGNITGNVDVLPTVLQQIHEINPNYNICSMEIFANIYDGETGLTLTGHTSGNTSAKVSFNEYSTVVMTFDTNSSGGYNFKYVINNKQEIKKLIFNYSGVVQINYIVSDFNQ